MKKPRVAVILSTYNGEKYLQEQIESVLGQVDVEVSIFVRDDKSTDQTLEILKTYEKLGNLNVIDNLDSNLGVGNSFMTVLYTVGNEFDYYAFCDQDDFWLPKKLSVAITKLEMCQKPALYCSDQYLVDSELNPIGYRHQNKNINTSYMQSLMANLITGCTMVWNRSLQELLVDEKRKPSFELLNIRIHDVWVSMVASITGQIIYDSESYIWYRQHANNVVGVQTEHIIKRWSKKIKRKQLRGRSLLAKETLLAYSDLIDKSTRQNLFKISTYRKKFSSKIYLLTHLDLFEFSPESRFLVILKILCHLV